MLQGGKCIVVYMDLHSSDVFGSAESWIKLGDQFAQFQVKEKYLKSTSILVRVGPGLFFICYFISLWIIYEEIECVLWKTVHYQCRWCVVNVESCVQLYETVLGLFF